MADDKWLVRLACGADVVTDTYIASGSDNTCRHVVLCLPWAGGGTIGYRPLAAAIVAADSTAEVWAVRLPSRETRFGEKPVSDWRVVRDEVVRLAGERGLLPVLPHKRDAGLDRGMESKSGEAGGGSGSGGSAGGFRVSVFGHSMGALLAFEVAKKLEASGVVLSRVFLSGMRSPRLKRLSKPVAEMDDAAFIQFLRDLGGTPEELLRNEGMMEMLSPMLRADFGMVQSYVPEDGPPCLASPITLFAGKDDVRVQARRSEHAARIVHPCMQR